MKYLMMLTGYVFGHDPVSCEKKRRKLYTRMRWIAFTDYVKGLLDLAERIYFSER